MTVELPKQRGRLILIIAHHADKEPREQVNDSVDTAQIFGLSVDSPTNVVTFDDTALGYPRDKLSEVPEGDYDVQALLNVYELHTPEGRQLWLPPDRGEGQHWNEKPGNPYSAPKRVHLGKGDVRITLDRVIPELPEVKDTRLVKHIRVQSERLSKFWRRPVYLGAIVTLPEGFDKSTQTYPMMIAHGHYSRDQDTLRETPPDAELPPVNMAGIAKECPNGHEGAPCKKHGYERFVQETQYAFYKTWTGPKFPRVLLVEIQHATPYFDDSYAVNSANMGPYGDAITYELIPEIEKRFRGKGPRWRAMMGGSTGGWIALATQIFYPDEYDGAYAACPDPVSFSRYTTIDLYKDDNAYEVKGTHQSVPRPGERDYLGNVRSTIASGSRRELVLGTRGRSGEQWDIWQAAYSPVGPDGYPAAIWDKRTGKIDQAVAEYWREHFDLDHIVRRDWATLGPKLKGKLEVYVGHADNFYLNNAVYQLEETMKALGSDAKFDYGARDEHCWSGDHGAPNAVSRLTYAERFIPRWMARHSR